MTFEENVRAILNCNFSETKEEIIEIAVKHICKLKNHQDERSQGEWITVLYAFDELNSHEMDFVRCPFCKTIHHGRHNFCSYCGADMRGGANNG